MFAIIETGGKQYRVKEGDSIRVEKLPVEAGENVVFDRVLCVATDDAVKVGAPIVEGAAVSGKVVKQGKAKKIIVFKYKAKKNVRKKKGHRQPFTQVVIESIKA